MSPDPTHQQAFPLALAKKGEHLRIVAYRTGKGLGRKMANLGLTLGSEVEVVHRQTGGGMVVARGATRVALGAGAAQKIQVTLADEAEVTSTTAVDAGAPTGEAAA